MDKRPDHKGIVSEREIRFLRKELSYTQRFDLLMKLIRMNTLMKSAKPISK